MILPSDMKAHLVKVFNITRTGVTEIRDSEVIRDGYTADDLLSISHEKMTAYIGSEETFPRAWELTCMKARYELNPPPTPFQPNPPAVELSTENVKPQSHDTKKNK